MAEEFFTSKVFEKGDCTFTFILPAKNSHFEKFREKNQQLHKNALIIFISNKLLAAINAKRVFIYFQ